MDIYPWIVIGHVFFVIVAFAAHGVSAFASFRIKRSTDRAELRTLLDLSATALVAAGIGLLIVIVLGLWAAIIGGHLSRAWPWVSIVVLVVVTSAHRGEAFAACEFVMDYLKTRAPFWKKEQTGAGARWVEARGGDDVAAQRWEQ